MDGELFCNKEEEEHLEHTSSRFEVKKNCTSKLLNFRPKGIFWALAQCKPGVGEGFSPYFVLLSD